MNTLMGDPTTEKLLPLIDAAAEAGAEVFCIDAGWYDDGGHWWPSVGEWRRRRPGSPTAGCGGCSTRSATAAWCPVCGSSPRWSASQSPAADAAAGRGVPPAVRRRIVEQERYHLDLRHPAARAHLDEVVDRLVEGYGVRFFKFDYNITPGPGTDHDASRRRRAARAQPRPARLADGVPRAPPRPADRELRLRRDADGLRTAVVAPPAVDHRPAGLRRCTRRSRRPLRRRILPEQAATGPTREPT